MIYPYFCKHCKLEFEVIKPMAKSGTKEKCQVCHKHMQRIFTARLEFYGTAVNHAEFNPAFGKVIKNKRELKYEIDKTGAIELGNEKPETVHKHFDELREETRLKKWDKF